jgi:hypothetical protein
LKKPIGILLWSGGQLIDLLTLLAAFVYVVGCVLWLHAPVVDVLLVTATMALPILAIAWLCRKAGNHLRRDALPSLPPASRTKRWMLAACGIVVVVAFAAIGRAGLSVYKCSTDPSRHDEAEIRRNGFKRMCDGDLARYDISFKSIAKATRDLAFTPVDLTHTPFARLEPLGGRAEWMFDVPSRLYRGFRMPDGHILTLSEHDMSADGTRSRRRPEDEPERINGLPARLGVFEDQSGTAVSHLSWVEGRRDYELWINAKVAREPLREQLFALAASLPRSVPACPNEPPRQYGADGRLIEEPLTQAQEDAILNRSKRPCK